MVAGDLDIAGRDRFFLQSIMTDNPAVRIFSQIAPTDNQTAPDSATLTFGSRRKMLALAKSGMLLPLDRWIYRDENMDGRYKEGIDSLLPNYLRKWDPASINALLYNDHFFFLPVRRSVTGILYRKDLVEKSSQPLPNSIDPEEISCVLSNLIGYSTKLGASAIALPQDEKIFLLWAESIAFYKKYCCHDAIESCALIWNELLQNKNSACAVASSTEAFDAFAKGSVLAVPGQQKDVHRLIELGVPPSQCAFIPFAGNFAPYEMAGIAKSDASKVNDAIAILNDIAEQSLAGPSSHLYRKYESSTILRALVLGYEDFLTAEDFHIGRVPLSVLQIEPDSAPGQNTNEPVCNVCDDFDNNIFTQHNNMQVILEYIFTRSQGDISATLKSIANDGGLIQFPLVLLIICIGISIGMGGAVLRRLWQERCSRKNLPKTSRFVAVLCLIPLTAFILGWALFPASAWTASVFRTQSNTLLSLSNYYTRFFLIRETSRVLMVMILGGIVPLLPAFFISRLSRYRSLAIYLSLLPLCAPGGFAHLIMGIALPAYVGESDLVSTLRSALATAWFFGGISLCAYVFAFRNHNLRTKRGRIQFAVLIMVQTLLAAGYAVAFSSPSFSSAQTFLVTVVILPAAVGTAWFFAAGKHTFWCDKKQNLHVRQESRPPIFDQYGYIGKTIVMLYLITIFLPYMTLFWYASGSGAGYTSQEIVRNGKKSKACFSPKLLMDNFDSARFFASRHLRAEWNSIESFAADPAAAQKMLIDAEKTALPHSAYKHAARELNKFKMSLDPHLVVVKPKERERLFREFVKIKYTTESVELAEQLISNKPIPKWLLRAEADEDLIRSAALDIERLAFLIAQAKLGVKFSSWADLPIYAQPPHLLSPRSRVWDNEWDTLAYSFNRSVPPEAKHIIKPDYYWHLFLHRKYTVAAGIENVWGCGLDDIESLALPMVPPSQELQYADWQEFILKWWPRSLIVLPNGYNAHWQNFAQKLAQQRKIAGPFSSLLLSGTDILNNIVSLPQKRPSDPELDFYWCEFLESGLVPAEKITLITAESQFADFVRGEYLGGRIESLNEEWGTIFNSFDEIPLALEVEDYLLLENAITTDTHRSYAWRTALDMVRGDNIRVFYFITLSLLAGIIGSLFSTISAYGFSRLNNAATRSLLFLGCIAGFFPFSAVAAKSVSSGSAGSWIFTLLPFLGSGLSVAILKRAFDSIDKDLYLMARLEGWSFGQIILRAILPEVWHACAGVACGFALVSYGSLVWPVVSGWNGSAFMWISGNATAFTHQEMSALLLILLVPSASFVMIAARFIRQGKVQPLFCI